MQRREGRDTLALVTGIVTIVAPLVFFAMVHIGVPATTITRGYGLIVLWFYGSIGYFWLVFVVAFTLLRWRNPIQSQRRRRIALAAAWTTSIGVTVLWFDRFTWAGEFSEINLIAQNFGEPIAVAWQIVYWIACAAWILGGPVFMVAAVGVVHGDYARRVAESKALEPAKV